MPAINASVRKHESIITYCASERCLKTAFTLLPFSKQTLMSKFPTVPAPVPTRMLKPLDVILTNESAVTPRLNLFLLGTSNCKILVFLLMQRMSPVVVPQKK